MLVRQGKKCLKHFQINLSTLIVHATTKRDEKHAIKPNRAHPSEAKVKELNVNGVSRHKITPTLGIKLSVGMIVK